jgi:succinate dehydrogenase hydrophobic anchor subunit
MSRAVTPPPQYASLTWTTLCLLLVFSISVLRHGIHATEVIIDDLEYLKEVEERITFKVL